MGKYFRSSYKLLYAVLQGCLNIWKRFYKSLMNVFFMYLARRQALTRKSSQKILKLGVFGQNLRKVNRLEVNGKIFQICLETVISRFLGLFDHLEKVLKISDECLFRVPWWIEGTNAKIRPKSPQIGGRKIQKVTSIKYIVNKYIIIYYYILLYITIQYYYILLLYIIYNYYIIIIIIIWCFELTFGPSESGN